MNKEQLTNKAKSLDINIEGLDTNAKLEEAIASKEAEAIEIKEAEEVKSTRTLPIFEYKDEKFTFSQRTPDSLRVNGTVYKLAELVKNKEAVKFLVVGNSCFVEPKN